MKRKNLINVSKRIMAGCLSVAMILTGILVVPKEAKATTETTKAVHFDSSYIMSDYWSATDKKAPVKEGYVFGGWFEAADANTAGVELDTETSSYYAPLKNETAAQEGAVAKFVPAEVLSIKTQVGKSTDGSTTSMRILSTVDSKNYQAVGFEYRLATLPEDTTKDDNTGKEITKVYSAIRPHKGASDEDLYKPGDKFVKNVSQYFIAADVSSIKNESFTKIVYARPYWITMDGTKVMGLARNNRVEDNNNGYKSVGINLLPELVGEEYAAVAAGKIQVTYNTANYDVVETPDITVDNNTIGGKYLFPEMECHVDETTGTITFVGNADITDGTLTNLTADGLFANVRFVKAANATSDALDFAIKTEETDFCNWAEADVDAFVVQ